VGGGGVRAGDTGSQHSALARAKRVVTLWIPPARGVFMRPWGQAGSGTSGGGPTCMLADRAFFGDRRDGLRALPPD